MLRYDNRFFQLERQSQHYAPAKGQVVVCQAQDGSLAIEYRVARCAGRRFRPPPGREARRPEPQATSESLRHRAWPRGSGRRRLTTRGRATGARALERWPTVRALQDDVAVRMEQLGAFIRAVRRERHLSLRRLSDASLRRPAPEPAGAPG